MNRDELEAEIRSQAGAASEVHQYLDAFALQVRDYWRSQSPVRSGRYAASVQVYKKPIVVNGMPGRKVGATSSRAHLIEYGTGADESVKDQKGVPDGFHYVKSLGVLVSNNTPTPAWAPRAKTAAHFGGDETRVNEIVQDQNLEIALGDPGSMSQEQRVAALKQFNSIIIPIGNE